MNTCPKCKLPNNTLSWWQDSKTQVWNCYPCGMERREEQTKLELKYKKDNPINEQFKKNNSK